MPFTISPKMIFVPAHAFFSLMKLSFDLNLYLVTDVPARCTLPLAETVEAAIAGGVSIVQYRSEQPYGGAAYREALPIVEICRKNGVPFIVNDRIDLALALDADGVHIGQRDFPPAIARRILGPDKIIGFSCSNLDEVRATDESLVDYLGLGPVFPTQTKTDAAPAMGLDGLAVCAAATSLPVVAIGGINVGNASAVRAAGPHIGLAVVSAICAASDPRRAAEALR